MKNKYKYILIFLGFSILTFIYSNYIFRLDPDEMWNYGFAHNVLTGMVPYKDFNMIVTPLFTFSTVPILFLLGDRLLSLHIYTSMIVGLTTLFMYIKIGKKAFLVYPILLLGYLTNYNMLCVLLFSLFVLINDSKIKHKDIILGIIISLIFLTKQTVGAFLFIPLFIYSKNKLKTIISFMIPILIFLLYLIVNDALYNFIDYCFLGLFSFAEDNGFFSIMSVFVILCSLFVLYKLIKSKFNKSYYFYALMFQVMAIPMGDIYHGFTAFSVILFVILMDINLNKFFYRYLFAFIFITTILVKTIEAVNDNISFNIYTNNDFLYARNIREDITNYLNNYEFALEKANELEYDNLFVLSSNAYFLKLYKNQKLNKFDLINNGNMGYKSYQGYIDEIDDICKDSECVFIVEFGLKKRSQTNKEILYYPQNNATLRLVTGNFTIYKND